jgi:hypothetical protein
MARTPNYAFEKRKKDLERQQAKAEKAARKKARAEAIARGEILPDEQEPGEDGMDEPAEEGSIEP